MIIIFHKGHDCIIANIDCLVVGTVAWERSMSYFLDFMSLYIEKKDIWISIYWFVPSHDNYLVIVQDSHDMVGPLISRSEDCKASAYKSAGRVEQIIEVDKFNGGSQIEILAKWDIQSVAEDAACMIPPPFIKLHFRSEPFIFLNVVYRDRR